MPESKEQSVSSVRQARHQAKSMEQRVRRIKMKEMRDKGYSNVAIAEHMGVSESTVRRVLQQHNNRRG